MNVPQSHRVGAVRLRAAALCFTLGLLAPVAALALAPDEPGPITGMTVEAQSKALNRASAAVVGIRTLAVEDAASNATLGRAREGSGVVIGTDGLVLTIGYLILEADQVQLMLDNERSVPARVIAYDVATGFGLLQALAPLRVEPVPIGHPEKMNEAEPMMIASGGEAGGVTVARLVSRRSFAGYWEYQIDGALFTAPVRLDHSGAGLFNARGELLGIGSLVVRSTLADDMPKLPGNMFVPVDLLQPILDELRAKGSSAASRRAWLGLNCVELAGQVRVAKVTDDGPAEAGGVRAGDLIVSIDGKPVASLETLWKTLWSGGGPERDVVLEIMRDDAAQTLHVQSVDRARTLRRAQGV